VKGLEFDTVMVMPSLENFPFDWAREPDVTDAAEEARLCYVAMTRARNLLYIDWGRRENSWLKCQRYESQKYSRRYFFKGSPKEVNISWPGFNRSVENGRQEYLKTEVCLRDPLELRMVSRPNYQIVELLHQGQAIGQLSKDAVGQFRNLDRSTQLCVSNVIRITCGQYYQEHHANRWDRLHESVKHQGWFYTVLVEET